MRFSRKTRGRRQRDRETDRQTERETDRDRPGFKGPSVSFGAVGPKIWMGRWEKGNFFVCELDLGIAKKNYFLFFLKNS